MEGFFRHRPYGYGVRQVSYRCRPLHLILASLFATFIFFARLSNITVYTKRSKAALSTLRNEGEAFLREPPELLHVFEHELDELDRENLSVESIHSSNINNRVYCMVPTQVKQTKLWESILNSWGKRCDILKFFVDPPEDGSAVPPVFTSASGVTAQIVVVPMVRKGNSICADGKPCRHIWEKVWRSWWYVNEHDIDAAEWFLKIDDDTYFIPSNFRKYVREKGWNADDPHYFGHKLWYSEDYQLISGVCTAFSRQAVRMMTSRYATMKHEYGDRKKFPESHNTCVDRDGATEEKVTAKCLKDVDVLPEETIDDLQREYVIPLGIPFSLTYKRKANSTSWFWRHKAKSRGDMANCCSPNAWAFHGYKSSSRMNEMESYLSDGSIEELQTKLDSLSEKNDHWWLLWYIIELRKNIAADRHAKYWWKNIKEIS